MAQDRNGKQADEKSIRETDSELERWRRAAEDTFQQLDWAIGYLHGIEKHAEARTLATNRRAIRTRLLERSGQPLPDDAASAALHGSAEPAERP